MSSMPLRTTTFVPRITCYSTASYSSASHQLEGGLVYQHEPEPEQDPTRSTKPEVVISTDNEQVDSTGGHVRI